MGRATFWFWLFFYVFHKPPSNDCSSILYARYTRRDAYTTDNFRPVGRRGGGVFGRPNSLVRWIKNTVLIRETYSGRDADNHNNNNNNNIPRIWYTIRHVQCACTIQYRRYLILYTASCNYNTKIQHGWCAYVCARQSVFRFLSSVSFWCGSYSRSMLFVGIPGWRTDMIVR